MQPRPCGQTATIIAATSLNYHCLYSAASWCLWYGPASEPNHKDVVVWTCGRHHLCRWLTTYIQEPPWRCQRASEAGQRGKVAAFARSVMVTVSDADAALGPVTVRYAQ